MIKNMNKGVGKDMFKNKGLIKIKDANAVPSKRYAAITGAYKRDLEEYYTDKANSMALEHWGGSWRYAADRVGKIRVYVNNRLKKSMGRFIICRIEGVFIEIAGDTLKYGSKDIIEDTLLHEVCHNVLYAFELPYSDGSKEFESELRRIGASSTETNIVGLYYTHECDCKDNEFQLNRNSEGYSCYECGEGLRLTGEAVYDGSGEEPERFKYKK